MINQLNYKADIFEFKIKMRKSGAKPQENNRDRGDRGGRSGAGRFGGRGGSGGGRGGFRRNHDDDGGGNY